MNCVTHVQYLFCFIYWLYNTALLEDCITSSINVFFYYSTQSPLPLYFVLCFIRFHADGMHLFYSEHLFYF